MAERVPFSRRYETRKPAGGLIYDDVPRRVRDGLKNILFELRLAPGTPSDERLVRILYSALDREVPGMRSFLFVTGLVDEVEWDEFCDVCEEVWQALSATHRDWFSNAANAVFARRYFGYEMRNGQMERVGARVHEEAIAEARGILRDADLAGPDQQFQKAIGFFSRRPEPDCENCVKEAVSAVEGVARVAFQDDSILLSEAIKRLKKERDVHPTLAGLLDKLYAYRGDAEGVAHALTGEKEVRVEEAEFVLGVSASAIVYLARLYGRGVE